MKEFFEEAEVEIIEFTTEDVVTNSIPEYQLPEDTI